MRLSIHAYTIRNSSPPEVFVTYLRAFGAFVDLGSEVLESHGPKLAHELGRPREVRVLTE